MRRYQPVVALVIGLWLSVMAGRAQAEPQVAGYVTRVRGEVVVEAAAGRQSLALGHALHLGARVITGADARLEARMKDGAVLTLSARTEFVIQDVANATPNSDGSNFELLKGAFRAITAHTDSSGAGWQGAQSHPAPGTQTWQVRTPVAIIGVRGTELWGGFNLLDSGANTLDVVMLEGKGVYVENASGVTELKQGGDGTTVKGSGVAPAPIKVWGEKKLQAALQTVAW